MTEGIRVSWFLQHHEHRNYWLRFGFMRCHRRGELAYRELPWSARTSFGFDEDATAEPHKGNSLLVVERGGERVRCVVESNDSFYVMSHLVEHTDLYFCAGYNETFFRDRIIPPPLAWQGSGDMGVYPRLGQELIGRHGQHFDRVRPFIPIAPNLHRQHPLSAWRRKLRNLSYRMEKMTGDGLPWSSTLDDFEDRHAYLLSLRGQQALHDVVLLDTAWGWPHHRLALHRELAALGAAGRDIHSRVGWHDPSDWDGSIADPLDPEMFPVVTGSPVSDYERMLAQSRLAVFATGFHYGWRNIMTLALMVGLPVLADRTPLQPWFDLSRFRIDWNDSGDWSSVKPALDAMSDERRAEIARHNIAAFDELMTPEATARYVLRTALS